jgi:hypothetical protein
MLEFLLLGSLGVIALLILFIAIEPDDKWDGGW